MPNSTSGFVQSIDDPGRETMSDPIDLIEHLDWEVCAQWLRTQELYYYNLQLCLFSQPELEEP